MMMGHRTAAGLEFKAQSSVGSGRVVVRAGFLIAGLAFATLSCEDGTGPGSLDDAFVLISENDRPLPSDQGEPSGCCLTLSGSIRFSGAGYELRTSHQNKNNGITFDNSEQGTFTRQGNTLTFTRIGGAEGFPYLLGPGTVSADQHAVMLLYGDEGPGSDQIRALFRR